jgi:hypothetical protein
MKHIFDLALFLFTFCYIDSAMDRLSQINLNEGASIQVPSENSIEQPRQNLDTDMIESDSETVIVNSNERDRIIELESISEETHETAANRIIELESIPEETQAAANRAHRKRKHWKEDEHR